MLHEEGEKALAALELRCRWLFLFWFSLTTFDHTAFWRRLRSKRLLAARTCELSGCRSSCALSRLPRSVLTAPIFNPPGKIPFIRWPRNLGLKSNCRQFLPSHT